jgi:hypothetical protein
METKEGPAGKQTQKETEIDLRKKEIKSTAICVFFSFLQVMGILTAGREGKRRRSSARPARFPGFLQRRVNPRTASGGGVWRRCAATVHTGPKGFPAMLWIFGGLFCNF